MTDNDNKYQEILLTSNPDKQIEHFWLNFKRMHLNIITHNIKSNIDIKLLQQWSQEFNELQKLEKYFKIESRIKEFILRMAYSEIEHFDQYHYGILMTNIKRWNKIASSINQITQKTSWSPTKDQSGSLIGYLIEIGSYIQKKNDSTLTSDILSIFKSYSFDLESSYQDHKYILEETLIYALNHRIGGLVDIITTNHKLLNFLKLSLTTVKKD